jgi:hypothetical protein
MGQAHGLFRTAHRARIQIDDDIAKAQIGPTSGAGLSWVSMVFASIAPSAGLNPVRVRRSTATIRANSSASARA